MSFACASLNSLTKLKVIRSNIVVYTQLRWKKEPKRKPRYLPMAQSKVFVIPEKMYVPPDEQQLADDLKEEYYRHLNSLRKQFQDEIKQLPSKEEIILAMKKEEKEEFKLLLEENKKENERIKKIREETLEKEFQENQIQLLQMEEERLQILQEAKQRVEEIVKAEKEKSKGYITLENIDQAIENAIDNPININFTLNLDGTVNWEGKPSLEYEADMCKRIGKGKEA